MSKDTIIAMACCIGDSRSLEKKSKLIKQERIARRAAEIKAEWLKKDEAEGAFG